MIVDNLRQSSAIEGSMSFVITNKFNNQEFYVQTFQNESLIKIAGVLILDIILTAIHYLLSVLKEASRTSSVDGLHRVNDQRLTYGPFWV